MDDLLKDAIADAKAVRETAIANAKIALEEAFTPKLQNMLSQKIQNEVEDDEDEVEVEKEEEEMDDKEDEVGADEVPAEEGENPFADDEEVEEEGEMDDEVPAEDEPEMEEADDEEADEDELDLEAIIRELEAEINEEDEEGEERDEKDEVKEEDEEDEAKDDVKEEEEEDDSKEDVKEDSEFNLEEILDALKEDSDPNEEELDEVSKLRSELDETREAVKFMRDKLNEVNLLNAKLLFTNKLFRAYGLNNEQKMKVVETFDRATNLREVKLVYSTMAETFGAKKTEIKETKGSASKAVASTKSDTKAEVITEGDTMRDRFKKLANII